MPKDTKSLDNNKAPACESRGFVHKKEGVHFDTPSFLCPTPYFDGETMVEMPHHRPTMLSPFKNLFSLNFFNMDDL